LGSRRNLDVINPLNPELNPICYLLALLGAHHFLHVSRIRVKLGKNLLPFFSESFFFPSAAQNRQDQEVIVFNFMCCFVWVLGLYFKRYKLRFPKWTKDNTRLIILDVFAKEKKVPLANYTFTENLLNDPEIKGVVPQMSKILIAAMFLLLLTLRLLMSYIYIYIYIYIYGAPILDVSRSHTTTQHSR
jgi:hypothetical protein